MSVANQSLASEKQPKEYSFSSERGRSLISRIIQQYVPHPAHDYVLEGIGKALDGKDVFAVTPTGSGKTGYMAFTALVVKVLKEKPEVYPEAKDVAQKFPSNPLMLSICPTNYIEYQQVSTDVQFSLPALVINSDTIQEAKDKKLPDLWKRAEEDLKITIILISPEQLRSKQYETALKHPSFYHRIYALVVDEVHLLLTWGKSFRKPFQQIGLARSRLPDSVVLIALTATMRGGYPFRTVCRFLGLKAAMYHPIRRSNQRHDIQLIFRDISSPPEGYNFPELDWILEGKRNTIVFCRSIRLGNRVHEYLYHRDKRMGGNPWTVSERLRQYNSLSKEYNEHTRVLMHSQKCHVVFATSTLAVGVDLAGIEDVVIYGDPEDVDQLLQMVGRIRPCLREMDTAVTHRGIVYFSANARKRAEESLSRKPTGKNSAMLEDDSSNMDTGLAELYLAECKVDNIDQQYDNPKQDPHCSCPTCTRFPSPSARIPCICSGCSPEPTSTSNPSTCRKLAAMTPDVPKKHKRITKPMREHGTRQLKKFRMELFDEADPKSSSMLSPDFYFTDEEIKVILDQFASISSVEDVARLVFRNQRLSPHCQRLFESVQLLRQEFEEIKKAEKLKREEAKTNSILASRN
ncbi:P-loop containing nucleoside triphosphate hydrolase protein [Lentinula aff. detonsa]|uniref:DNA 3'-5' helicase n=1 Tax=Lentinula aff. detonsa TaxID=2804958 RepID=A0AA38NPS2_9AGAR|nr:P-loop containing nucleoside triphosphate hydrolase protein [Lentinula aff. detonsa]